MGFWSRLAGGARAEVDWDGERPEGLVAYHATRGGNVLRVGARLRVRDGWTAVLAVAGRAADVCPPGDYTLDAEGAAALTGAGRAGGVGSTFVADVYYLSSRPWAGVPWEASAGRRAGEKVCATGTCGFVVADPRRLYDALIRPDAALHEYPASNVRNVVAAEFAEWARKEGAAPEQFARRADAARERVAAHLAELGFRLTEFTVAAARVRNGHRPPDPFAGTDLDPGFPAPSGPPSARLPLAEAPAAASPLRPALPAPNSGRLLGLGELSAAFGSGPISGRFAPPPLPAEPPPASFHAVIRGAPSGPFDAAALLALAASGDLTPESLVWRRGAAGWLPARDVPELAAAFPGPPPLPG